MPSSNDSSSPAAHDPAHPTPVVAEPSRRLQERRALGVCAVAAILVMGWVSRGVFVGIFLGVLTGLTLLPLYGWMLGRARRPWVAQLVCLLAAAFAILVIVFGMSATLITRGSVMARELVAALASDGKYRPTLQLVEHKLQPLGINLQQIIDKLRDAAGSVASFAAGMATAIAEHTFRALLTVFFLFLTAQFILSKGQQLAIAAEDMLPLSKAHTRSLIAELRKVGRAILLGSVVTGLAQGLLAGSIFAILKVPEPIFFGVATAVASLVPGVGSMLVWVPAGIYLMATGHVPRGILEEVLSAVLVIGFCDYVLRPRLVGDESTPAVLTFAALFGGVEAFGLIGLLVGPLLMSLAVAVLRLYRADLTQPTLLAK